MSVIRAHPCTMVENYSRNHQDNSVHAYADMCIVTWFESSIACCVCACWREGGSGKWRQKGRNQSYHQDPKSWSWRQNLEAGWWIWSSSKIPCKKAGFLLEVVSLALSHVSVNIEWKNIVTGASLFHRNSSVLRNHLRTAPRLEAHNA